MPAPQKYDREALERDHDRRRSLGETQEDIAKDIVPGGMPVGTLRNILYQVRKKRGTKSLPQEPTTPEDTVEVLPGQMSIEDADTGAEVHYGAVHEFDRLPDGYAKVIQPMRPYSDAEEWALNESMRLYGFIGAIVCDQFGRVLDGNQRQRIARLRGLSVPHTITHVRDDAHAIEIATAANAVRRHYTQEQRQELAPRLRDQGFSYRAIAEALGVGKSTVYRDVFGELRINPDPVTEPEIVPNGTPEVVMTSETETNFTPEPIITDAPVPNGTPEVVMTSETETNFTPEPIITDAPVPNGTPQPEKRVKGRDQKSYPSQRPPKKTEPKPTAEITGLKWVKIFQSMFAKYTETVEAFQLEGGVTVLAREMPTEAQQLFLGLLRDQAQRWDEMVAHFERTIAKGDWTEGTPAAE